jgi:hypothetical protein
LLHEVDEGDELSRVEPNPVDRAHVDQEEGSSGESDALHLLATVRATDEGEERLPWELATRSEGDEVTNADRLPSVLAREKLAVVPRSHERAQAARALLHVNGRHVELDAAERRSTATRAWQIAG